MSVTAPMSLIVSGFAAVRDVRRTLTPVMKGGESRLILIDLGAGKNRLGASALAQVTEQLGDDPPDVDDASLLRRFFNGIQLLNRRGLISAYHDRSDGGLFVTLCEMAFASRSGIAADISTLGSDPIRILFNEELGGVIEFQADKQGEVMAILGECGLSDVSHLLGASNSTAELKLTFKGDLVCQKAVLELQEWWSETSYRMQALRDNPSCAREERQSKLDPTNNGLFTRVLFDVRHDIAAPFVSAGARPSIAILREQGVNGQLEMAAAFDRVGFDCVDVHMSDILDGMLLDRFNGLVACGGFSYGDVLGAGEGWAKSILFHDRARRQFERFFEDQGKFALGVCNGCQMLSNLKQLIPGADAWPHFVRNRSEQFEARSSLVKIAKSPSILLTDMEDSIIPIAVAHGEGRAEFMDDAKLDAITDQGLVAARFVDDKGAATQTYPANPNGSPEGITALTNPDGRITIMMPHPERVFRSVSNSWYPEDWPENSPWVRMFQNARVWIGALKKTD